METDEDSSDGPPSPAAAAPRRSGRVTAHVRYAPTAMDDDDDDDDEEDDEEDEEDDDEQGDY